VQHFFAFETRIPRVVFGFGTISTLKSELDKLGISLPLLLSTGRGARVFKAAIGSKLPLAGVFDSAVMHTPTRVTDAALACAASVKADGFVSFGGGSAIGLGKALSLRTRRPHLAVPTTYSGSEMTSVVGETSDGRKYTTRDPAILPQTVVYDVEQTLGLPVPTSVTSAMNGIAHGVEAMYAQNGNPLISTIAETAVRSLVEALPRLISHASDREGRENALYGAWLCGLCLNASGMALHHKLCHELGGAFGLPHAETHTILLPHSLAYNAPAIPEAYGRLQRAVSNPSPQRHLFDLAQIEGLPHSLRELGMPQAGIEQTVERVIAEPYWNPRALEAAPLRDLLHRAFEGTAPA
jgi:maleylacetate reductase